MLKRHRVEGLPETSCGQSPLAERFERPTNLAQRLLDRQLDRQVQRSFSKKCMRERFSRFRLSRSLDLHAPRPELPSHAADSGRSRIMEIVAAGATIFGLAENGICAAFDSDSGKRICVLNTDTTEVVRSLFHNKANSTLITVAVHAVDQYSSLRCRSNPLSQLRAGVIDTGTALFTTESLRWPGFVEFDDVNGKVVTYSADVSLYKAWQMSDPCRVLYSLDGGRIDEIKISPGIMLLVLRREDGTGHVPLRLLSIETGATLVELEQPIVPGKNMANPNPNPNPNPSPSPNPSPTPTPTPTPNPNQARHARRGRRDHQVRRRAGRRGHLASRGRGAPAHFLRARRVARRRRRRRRRRRDGVGGRRRRAQHRTHATFRAHCLTEAKGGPRPNPSP